jgi:hypothetical protein
MLWAIAENPVASDDAGGGLLHWPSSAKQRGKNDW